MDTYAIAGGAFADVYKGRYKGQTVCCKKFRLLGDSSHPVSILRVSFLQCFIGWMCSYCLQKFAKEIVLWAHSSHHNVLPFYGVYAFEDPVQGISLISPWMKNGNLRQYFEKFPDARRVPLVSMLSGLVQRNPMQVLLPRRSRIPLMAWYIYTSQK